MQWFGCFLTAKEDSHLKKQIMLQYSGIQWETNPWEKNPQNVKNIQGRDKEKKKVERTWLEKHKLLTKQLWKTMQRVPLTNQNT